MDFSRTLGVGLMLLISYLLFHDVTQALHTSDPQKSSKHFRDAFNMIVESVLVFSAGYIFMKVWNYL